MKQINLVVERLSIHSEHLSTYFGIIDYYIRLSFCLICLICVLHRENTYQRSYSKQQVHCTSRNRTRINLEFSIE